MMKMYVGKDPQAPVSAKTIVQESRIKPSMAGMKYFA